MFSSASSPTFYTLSVFSRLALALSLALLVVLMVTGAILL